MRIIGGKLKGRRLQACKGRFVRPTSDKIREAIFDIIAPFLSGGVVLDLFAGTGGVGIEALSRGMERTVFVEKDSRVIPILKKNIIGCQLEDRVEVISRSVSAGIKIISLRNEKFKLIFLDPPYQENLVERTLEEIWEANLLSKGGIVIAEHSTREMVGKYYGKLAGYDCRRYGNTLLSFFTY
ncbi:MAG: 16S rRNA (guanine(966)-N(2))-methyltransferase RsmD [Proteobacteria bacterium]|nr:16S rRNA (guanine(966)-N(2))-methyltransferase RsmD [Pseudomonadota bacterium]